MSIYSVLADLLDYPKSGLVDDARLAVALLARGHPSAAEAIGAFLTRIEAMAPGALEELYTATFDLGPTCPPYVGHHLFGDSFKRSAFLVELGSTLRAHGIDPGQEQPDHLALVLRLLDGLERAEDRDQALALARDLRSECLEPALRKMLQALGPDTGNPYYKIIEAALLVMEGGCLSGEPSMPEEPELEEIKDIATPH